MTTKLIEVRDHGTRMTVLAIRLDAEDASWNARARPTHDRERQRWLLASAGYGRTLEEQREYILVVDLGGMEVQHDPYNWRAGTLRTLTAWLRGDVDQVSHFDDVVDGQVVDVRVITGDRETAVESDQGEGWGLGREVERG